MDATGVSIWEKGLAICKATKLRDGRYHVEFEYVKVLDTTDATDVVAAFDGSSLASGVNSLVRGRVSCKLLYGLTCNRGHTSARWPLPVHVAASSALQPSHQQ
jgi:hypothetical protein